MIPLPFNFEAETERLNELQRECIHHRRQHLALARQAGAILTEVGKNLAEGTIRDWIPRHFEGTADDAASYLFLANMTPETWAAFEQAQGMAIAQNFKHLTGHGDEPVA